MALRQPHEELPHSRPGIVSMTQSWLASGNLRKWRILVPAGGIASIAIMLVLLVGRRLSEEQFADRSSDYTKTQFAAVATSSTSSSPDPVSVRAGFDRAVFVFNGERIGPPANLRLLDDALFINDKRVLAAQDFAYVDAPHAAQCLQNAYSEFASALKRGGMVFYSTGRPIVLIPPGEQSRRALRILEKFEAHTKVSTVELDALGLGVLAQFQLEKPASAPSVTTRTIRN